MSKKNTLFKNTIFKSLLNIVNIVVPLIIGPYIMRLLDVDLYGTYNRVLSEFQVFMVFAAFGVYTLGVREISKVRDDEKKVSKIFTNLFVISLMSNLLIMVIYTLYAILTSSGTAQMIYFVFNIQIIANVFYVEFVNEALENYKFITIKSIIVKIIYLISILLFIKNPDDVVIYAIVVSATIFLNNIISFIYAKSPGRHCCRDWCCFIVVWYAVLFDFIKAPASCCLSPSEPWQAFQGLQGRPLWLPWREPLFFREVPHTSVPSSCRSGHRRASGRC